MEIAFGPCGRRTRFTGYSWSFMFKKHNRDDGFLNANCRKWPVNYHK